MPLPSIDKVKRDNQFEEQLKDINWLQQNHPEFNNSIGVLLTTVLRCKDNDFNISNVTYQGAYEHYSTCDACTRNYEQGFRQSMDNLTGR